MVETVWLHIGSAKSGTSSLQKHFHTHRGVLAEQGLAYLSIGRKASVNDLAVAYNKRRDDLATITGRLNEAIETRPEPMAMLSSEMLFGFRPEVIFELLPGLKGRKLNVLVYLRRQDRYIEAVYLQKAKNYRFKGTLADYIAHFKGSGSDYADVLSPWMQSDATLVPRVMERPKLTGESVVTDALAQIGLPWMDIEEERDTNVTPGIHRVQLLQAAASIGLADPRRLQRRLAAQYPQNPEERGSVMTQEERRAYLDTYAACNETLRGMYFPDDQTLFDESDFEDGDDPAGIRPFSDRQMAEITRLLRVVKSFQEP